MNITTKKSLLATMIALFASGATVQTVAQTDESRPAMASRALDEIIVTAEKREQNVQDVPVAISAFTAGMLEARGISTPQDLQFAVPGLSIGEQNNTGGTAKVTIRGIGMENYQPGGDPGVPIHINGHYTQSTAYVFRDMIDVERVEVQRGPQGTLYGRNAMGGNINIITKRPTEEFEGMVSADVGNFEKRQVQAVLSGPLSDNLRGRLVIADDTRDGYVKDIGLVGDDRDTSDYTSVRGALEFDVTDNFQVYLNAYYFDDKANPYSRRLDNNPANIANVDPWKVRTNTPSEQTDESKGVSLDLSWGLTGMEFRSMTAYDDTYKTALLDTDNSDTRDREFFFGLGYKTLTQEFQLSSIGGSPLQWLTGLFYYREDSNLVFNLKLDTFDTNGNGISLFGGDLTDPRFLFDPTNDLNAESIAVFGQIDYALTDQLELIGGLRWTRDEKDRFQITDISLEDGTSVSLFGGAFVAPSTSITRDNLDGEEWSEVTGKLGINYHVNDDMMFYGSYSRGYKAGGYNSDQDNAYDPETVDAFELGMKSQWLNDRVQANVAAFYYLYNDKQDFKRFLNPATGLGIFQLVNAAKAEISGFELEMQAYVSDAFFVDGAISYLNAEFDEFNSIDTIFPDLGEQDLSGNKLSLSPEWKINIGAEYDWDLGGSFGNLTVRGDYVWVDDQYANAFNRHGTALPGDGDLVPSYHLANARLWWESNNETWFVELYVKNLMDEYIVSNTFVAAATDVNVSQMAPRTYGLKLSYRF